MMSNSWSSWSNIINVPEVGLALTCTDTSNKDGVGKDQSAASTVTAAVGKLKKLPVEQPTCTDTPSKDGVGKDQSAASTITAAVGKLKKLPVEQPTKGIARMKRKLESNVSEDKEHAPEVVGKVQKQERFYIILDKTCAVKQEQVVEENETESAQETNQDSTKEKGKEKGNEGKGQQNFTGKKGQKAEDRESVDWSTLKSLAAIRQADLCSVPSRLAPKPCNRKKSTLCHWVTGREVERRASPPENMSVKVLGDMLRLANSGEDKKLHHDRIELRRIMSLLLDKDDKPQDEGSTYSAFSLLTEGDVDYFSMSLELLFAKSVDKPQIRQEMETVLGGTKRQKQEAVDITRQVVSAAIEELEKTNLDTYTHGGMQIIKAAWSIINSILPSNSQLETL